MNDRQKRLKKGLQRSFMMYNYGNANLRCTNVNFLFEQCVQFKGKCTIPDWFLLHFVLSAPTSIFIPNSYYINYLYTIYPLPILSHFVLLPLNFPS